MVLRSPILTRQREFMEKVHFCLNGNVKSRNAVFLVPSPSDQVISKQFQSQKVTAWIGLRVGVLIGPVCFEDEDEKAQTINADQHVETALKPFCDEVLKKVSETSLNNCFSKTELLPTRQPDHSPG